ncbi:MAG: type II toxin-antitoxin system prevent-host-death family antitoxin [Candidatus Hydrogenedentes bacterium]|nr:type II toxin-antitoxin system prevent-host-death family antitoxin [Candidatus Hydrogenedentota bacterium]
MTTLSTTQLAREVEKAISMVTEGHEQVIITEDGQQVAALVSIEDLDLIRKLEDEADIRAVEEAKAEGLDPTPYEEFRKELGL